MNTAGTELPLVRLDELSLILTGNVVECELLLPAFTNRFTDVYALYRYFIVINVTDGWFCKNGTTSVLKSVLRYYVDKVRQESESEV